MHALLRRLKDINAPALAVLIVLFFALLMNGANSAAGAALLSIAALVSLAIAAAAATGRALKGFVATNWLSIAAALIFLSLAFLSTQPSVPWFERTHPLWAMLGDGAWPGSISPYRTLEGAVALLSVFAAYALGALLAPDSKARDWAGRWLVGIAIIYTFAGLYLFFATPTSSGARLDVGVSSANAAAALFGVLALIAAALLVRAARGRLEGKIEMSLPSGWRWAGFALKAPMSSAAMLLLFACLLLTASRGGLLATLAGFLIFAAAIATQSMKHVGARGGVLLAPIAIVAGAFALLFARGGEDVMQRFALAAEDLEMRRALADAHWRFVMDRPLFGHGLNTYHELNTLAATPENWRALRAPGSTHNIFIQVLEETGVVGLGLWALMLATPIFRAISRIARRRSGAEWAAAAFAATALLLLHGVVDFTLQVPAIAALYAFILGMTLGRAERRTA